MLIGVVISGLVEEYTKNICSGIELASKDDDVQFVVIPGKYIGMDYESDVHNKYGYCFNSLFSYGLLSCFDGLIIEMASVLMFAEEGLANAFAERFKDVPHVFVSFDKAGPNYVSIDNKAGLKEALEYMYDNGARKFAMLGGPANSSDANERKSCFEEFIKNHNLFYSDNSFINGSFWLDCSEEANKLFEDNQDADVFVCANDIIGKYMYEACKKHGVTPGKDVSVLGFDNSDFCIATYPTMSSIKIDIAELGKAAYKQLIKVIEGKKIKPLHVPSEFILRDSIVHRQNDIQVEDVDENEIKDMVKINTFNFDAKAIKQLKTNVKTLFNLISTFTDYEYEFFAEKIVEAEENLFLSEAVKMLDWELFVNAVQRKYKVTISNCKSLEKKQKYSELYAELIEQIMKFCQTMDENRGNNHIDYFYCMEKFFRESLQFARYTDASNSRLLENLDFLGIKNACLYLYEHEISYMQGETFEIPKFHYLTACLKEGNIVKVPSNKQKIKSENIFQNSYFDGNTYNRLSMFPLYSEKYVYGVIVCDMRPSGYEKADMFANQMSAAVRMARLRAENNRIMNEYEESLRRLKENNITLDTMTKTDHLTGLNNRRGFYVRANKLMETYPNDNSLLLFGYADMNDLKIINDRFGHDDGDFALKSIGSVLADFVTGYNGFVARIGGDEFVFAIPISVNEADNDFKSEIYAQFEAFNKSSAKPYNVGISVGCFIVDSNNNLSIDDILIHADENLYEEKLKKKGNVVK